MKLLLGGVAEKVGEHAMYCRCRDMESVGVGRAEGGAVVTGVGMEPHESGGDAVNLLRIGVWAGG